MARRRPQIRGQGADVFLAQLPSSDVVVPTAPSGGDKRVMVTVYLPPALVEQLDRAWLERRMHDRKVQKSHIVAEALETYLQS
jgi:hypothetical protein